MQRNHSYFKPLQSNLRAQVQEVDASFPGAYSYEVTEALGQMVAGHLVSTGDFPTEPEWQTTLGELALEFFEHGSLSQDEMSGLREVVARQFPRWQASPSPNPFDAPPLHISIKPPPDGVHSQANA